MRNSIDHNEKDIYELLNYADIDDKTYDIFQLDEMTSKRINKRIHKKLFKKKRLINYITVAILLICVGTFSISNSTFASVIQKSIIEKFQTFKGNYANYTQYSSTVNLSAYDKGVTFTVNEIVCDDNELLISYSIVSDDKLTNVIQYPNDIVANFNLNGENISTGHLGNGMFINDTQYDGLMKLNIMRSNLSDIFYLDLDILSLDQLDGTWKFNLKVNKEEIHKETKTYEINQTINIGKEPLAIKRIITSPLSTSIEIDKLSRSYFFLFDDKGNMIKETSRSCSELSSELHFEAFLHDDTKSLTLLPFSCNENYISNPRVYDMANLPLELPQGELGKLVVNNFEWEDDTLKVSYTAEGKIPAIQAKYLCLYDDQGKNLNLKNTSYNQVTPENQHDFVMYFKGVSKDKKYKIGTLRLEEFYKLDEASKVTIDLK